MKDRRHHNTDGRRGTARGKRVREVIAIAKKLNLKYKRGEANDNKIHR